MLTEDPEVDSSCDRYGVISLHRSRCRFISVHPNQTRLHFFFLPLFFFLFHFIPPDVASKRGMPQFGFPGCRRQAPTRTRHRVTHPTMRAVFRTLRGNGPAATTADHGHRPPHLRGDGCLKSLGSESPLQFGFKGRPAPARTLAIGVTRPTLSLRIIESDSSRLGLGTTKIGPWYEKIPF
jgi:hypothetical protein